MNKPWISKTEIEISYAQKLIETQFPELSPVSLKFLGSGWDNTVYKVNNLYTFRFPRRDVAVEELLNEIHSLNAVAQKLPVAIPEPLFIGTPTAEFSRPFYGHRFLEGTRPSLTSLTQYEYEQLAIDLAHTLKALHTLDAHWGKQHELEECGEKIDFEKRSHKALTALEEVQQSAVLPQDFDYEMMRNFFASCRTMRSTEPFVVVHSDLRPSHLLVDTTNKLSGIIDWGDIHIGPAGLDLSLVYWFFPITIQEIFFKIYGSINENTKQIALFKCAYACSWMIKYGLDVNEPYFVQEGITGLLNIESILKLDSTLHSG